jgi:hypothetical protein
VLTRYKLLEIERADFRPVVKQNVAQDWFDVELYPSAKAATKMAKTITQVLTAASVA